MPKIPLVLINGALGSGKTTLVKRLLKDKGFAGSYLIENEFASVNIDRAAIADEHDDEIYEISGSFICCSTGAELEAALDTVVAKGWTRPVILEATGMANSGLLLRRLFLNQRASEHFKILSAILLIDAAEVTATDMSKELQLEVRLADLVVINKADLAPVRARQLQSWVEKINPDAVTKSAVGADIDLAAVTAHESNTEVAFARVFPELAGVELDESTYAVVDLDGPLDPAKVRAALRPEAFGSGVRLRRAKGFFVDHDGNYWHVEATAKHLEISKLATPKQPVIVAIGDGITKDAVRKVLL